MDITPKLGGALLLALIAPGHCLTRCRDGFRDRDHAWVVTRRTANTLVETNLADYNDRTLPSALTLTPKGVAVAQEFAAQTVPVAA